MAGLYIHIPFCASKCTYCDFYSETKRDLLEPFLKALVQEMDLRSDYLPPSSAIETLYFGGGTPSLLCREDFSLLFDAVSRHWTLAADAEITLEANPDDLTPAYLAGLACLRPRHSLADGRTTPLCLRAKLRGRHIATPIAR